jgi:hypothetical protein
VTKCILCGNDTEGSKGAAGTRITFICQPCRDIEDRICLDRCVAIGRAFDAFANLLLPKHLDLKQNSR